MLEIISSGTKAGKQHNEDLFGVSGHFAWMMDGVTGITEEQLFSHHPSDAIWFTETLHQNLQTATRSCNSLKELLSEALRATIQQANEQSKAFQRVQAHLLPAASLTVLHLKENSIEIASIGDCPALARQRDGSVLAMGDTRVASFEKETIDLLVHLQQTNPQASNNELFEELKPQLTQQRKNRNTSQGFWVADPTHSWLPEIIFLSFPRQQLTRILLCTDGLFRLCDHFHETTPGGLIEAAELEGIPALIERVRELEREDQDCRRAPRVKVHDDATGLLLDIS